MSISTRILSGVYFCALTLALGTSTLAQTADTPSNVQGTIAQLSDKELRRINHYSEQALTALRGYRASGDAERAIKVLRQKIQRLIDAGQRSGLDSIATADYFEAYIAENPGPALPEALLDTEGRFNARSLLTSVELYFENAEPEVYDFTASDEADMAAIRAVAQGRTPPAPGGQPAELLVTEQPAIVLELPAIAPNTPADVRAILERVQLRGEDWVITVQQGDSLARFANALYGDPGLFPRIFRANSNVLVSPSTITVGQVLVLPKG